jgi:hypothetical protein
MLYHNGSPDLVPHRNFEFSVAKRAHCNDRGRAEPFDDFKIALFRTILLNHRTESLTHPEVDSIYEPVHLLTGQCFLTAALASAVRRKWIFFRPLQNSLHRPGNLHYPQEIWGRMSPLNGSKLAYAKASYRSNLGEHSDSQ